MITETIQRPTAQVIGEMDGGSWRTWRIPSDEIPAILEIPNNTIIALDVHGTLISRTQADDLRVVQAFRRMISGPAKEAGAKLVMASAAPTRELQRVASLLDLGDQPAVAELGHVIMRAVLGTPPRLACDVTPEMQLALLDLKRWLVNEGLPPGIFLEPKTILVSLNWSEAPQERDGLVESIQGYIDKRGLPFYVSVSDATLDVGIDGVNKASGLSRVIASLRRSDEGMHILAVGDSRNDMDLLQVSFPGLCGCPANSHPLVKAFVSAQGGVVSEYPTLAGTLDALSQLIQRISPQDGCRADHKVRRSSVLSVGAWN